MLIINDRDSLTYSYFQLFFIDQPIYITILGLCKLSMLVFYLRIFPSKLFKLACLGLIMCTVCYTIIFICFAVFQCLPLSYTWEGWKGESQGKCVGLASRAYASAGINIVLDVGVLILPAPSLWRLNLSIRRKIGVFLMLGVGVL